MKLIVTNTITGAQYLVADFVAEGDLIIAMGALQRAAPEHLQYSSEYSKPVRWNFNFVNGGWNSVVATSKAEAITLAKQQFEPKYKIDFSSFRAVE